MATPPHDFRPAFARLCAAMRWPEPDPPTTRNRTIQAPRVVPPARVDTRTVAGFARWRGVLRDRGTA